jgi:adenosylhomocysteinase
MHAPGVIPLTDGLQVAVSKKWLQIHSQTFAVPGADKDKVFFYPESWDRP